MYIQHARTIYIRTAMNAWQTLSYVVRSIFKWPDPHKKKIKSRGHLSGMPQL